MPESCVNRRGGAQILLVVGRRNLRIYFRDDLHLKEHYEGHPEPGVCGISSVGVD